MKRCTYRSKKKIWRYRPQRQYDSKPQSQERVLALSVQEQITSAKGYKSITFEAIGK